MTAAGIFIIPYFGKLPNYFPFWIKSCEGNPFFHWLLITDAEIRENIPQNVIIKKMAFETFVQRLQNYFNFTISLERPYKICDFRPAFGAIFQQEISDYGYWGFCDMDLIWGTLTPLADIVKLGKYDKILDLGHCTLLKNTPMHTNAYQSRFHGSLFYQDVFSDSRNMVFDEDGTRHDGFSSICEKLGMSVFTARKTIADIKIRNFSLQKLLYDTEKTEKRHNEVYLIDSNAVTEIYKDKKGTICYENELYVHFQKRKISVETENVNHCLLIPPGKIIDVPEDIVQNLSKLAPEGFRCIYWNLKVFFRRAPILLKMKFFHCGKLFLNFLRKFMHVF